MYTNQAIEIFYAATKAVQPQSLLPKYFSRDKDVLHIADQEIKVNEKRKVILIAVGKAASGMAAIIENQIGDMISKGYCITKHQHAVPLKYCSTIEAAHPAPDANSIRAGEIILQVVRNLTVDDIVILLLSGGGSSLLADIPEACSLQEINSLYTSLVNSGASIHEINIVRKHLSLIKGGQLAKAANPAKIFTLIISDVIGDEPGSIASGPTVPDPSTFDEAYTILKKYKIWEIIAESIKIYITRGLKKEIEETPKPGSPYFKETYTYIIGNNTFALETAKNVAEQFGYSVYILNDQLTGHTEKEARKFIQYLISYTGKLPACILLGGETTLKVTRNGKGGRNQHFVLCALKELQKEKENAKTNCITILSAGTDGTDGPTDAAGAVFSHDPVSSGLIDEQLIERYLTAFDSYNYFLKNGGLIKTGPTQTNVMDIVIALLH